MLESRSAYGYYGWRGGVTGENDPYGGLNPVKMPYRTYKGNYRDNKTVPDSYDPEDKTIYVLLTDEQYKKMTNFGNRYRMNDFYFVISSPFSDGVIRQYVAEFKAKNHENAVRNAKRYVKQANGTLIREATFSEYCAYINGHF